MSYPNSRGDYREIWRPGFEWQSYLRRYDPRLMQSSEGRRAICHMDPFAFSLIYFREWLSSPETGGAVTFWQFHADSYEWALTWPGDQGHMGNRHAWMAPRGSAKSTIHFRILPIWALAYEHRGYAAIFTKATAKAEEHMQAVRLQLRHNALLRLDFPELCEPMMTNGKAAHDTLSVYMATSGAVLTASGMDSSVLGASIDGKRADLIVLDDVEGDESNYSPYQARKRLNTITGAIGFYNTNAIWSWVGTTTMYGGLTHDMVRTTTGLPQDSYEAAPELGWVREQKLNVHHYRALPTDPDTGETVSCWPARWATADLVAISHTRDFAMQMDNMPSLGDEGMWSAADFTYVDRENDDHSRQALFVDPSVTQTAESDYTGLCVSQYPWPSRGEVSRGQPGRVEILHSERVKKTGHNLRDHIMRLLTRFPHCRRVIVEDNQGAALWLEVFADLPVEVELIHATASKEVRAGHALVKYQSRPTQVVHVGRFPGVEGVMQAFPLVAHDDDLDALVYAVLYWLSPAEVRKKGAGAVRSAQVSGRHSYVS